MEPEEDADEARRVLRANVANFEERCSSDTVEALLLGYGYRCAKGEPKQDLYKHSTDRNLPKILVPRRKALTPGTRKAVLDLISVIEEFKI